MPARCPSARFFIAVCSCTLAFGSLLRTSSLTLTTTTDNAMSWGESHVQQFSNVRRAAGLLALVAASSLAAAGPSVADPGRCAAGLKRLGSQSAAYAAVLQRPAIAYRAPGDGFLARLEPKNVNTYPTVLGVQAAVLDRDCRARWYRVQIPLRPNGSTGYVRANAVWLGRVTTRIVVDLSERRVSLFRRGRLVLRAPAAIGSRATPTPRGRFYVNQRLIPRNRHGPYGPAALGISAFSNVLTGWTQGGPIGIHGTDEPWTIGRRATNGCIRLHNHVVRRLFRATPAGTPVTVTR
jgi:lipoprotein-anchoring transpeptidase ErfK/SrfK